MSVVPHPPLIHVIIVAAGIGQRFNRSSIANNADLVDSTRPKQYQYIVNKSVLAYSIAAFDTVDVAGITVVLHPDDQWFNQQTDIESKHPLSTCQGGEQRHDSVRNGLKALNANADDWVLIHDAARPVVSQGEITELIQTCIKHQQGGLLVKPISDTIKRSTNATSVVATVDRDELYAALTPQMFRCGELLQGLTVFEAGTITDESSAMEAQGQQPIMVMGKSSNIKITTADDLILASAILKQQGRI